VAFLCRRYKVSRSGFYAWAGREGSQRQRNDQALGARIERIHRDSGARYGSPRVHQVLRREGVRCSNKRVARLMRERGLRARVSRLYRKGSGMVRRFFAKTGNLRLDGNFIRLRGHLDLTLEELSVAAPVGPSCLRRSETTPSPPSPFPSGLSPTSRVDS
jgi:transposase InsO family protein